MAHEEIAVTECSQIKTFEGRVTVCTSTEILVEYIQLLTSALIFDSSLDVNLR
jgi:hypothetical protein